SNMHEHAPIGGGSLLKQALFEGAMTAVVMQNTALKVWVTLTQSGVRRLTGSATPLQNRGVRSPETLVSRAAPTQNRSEPQDTAGRARFELFTDTDGSRRFRLLSASGEAILTSRGYADAKGARGGMQSLSRSMVLEDRYQRRSDDSNGFCFEIRAGNNRVLWTSATYDTEAELEADLERLVRTAREAARAPDIPLLVE
ncbi:MAG: DUF1508 domain-containing protein, partial [Pseudomonadales bacterium]